MGDTLEGPLAKRLCSEVPMGSPTKNREYLAAGDFERRNDVEKLDRISPKWLKNQFFYSSSEEIPMAGVSSFNFVHP